MIIVRLAPAASDPRFQVALWFAAQVAHPPPFGYASVE